jgi:hypothetical protein
VWFELRREQWFPRPLEEVFAFFADARNLETITPPWLAFEVLTSDPIAMRPGSLIDYRLRLHGVPLRWRTEIAACQPPHRFVDTQRRGPYREWVHEHTFTARGGGTVVGDHVRYRVPGGRLVHELFVRRDVERIFDFRHGRLAELLGSPGAGGAAPQTAPAGVL